MSKILEVLGEVEREIFKDKESNPYEGNVPFAVITDAFKKARALDGEKHIHVAGEGNDIDTCGLCGQDIRSLIHLRVG